MKRGARGKQEEGGERGNGSSSGSSGNGSSGGNGAATAAADETRRLELRCLWDCEVADGGGVDGEKKSRSAVGGIGAGTGGTGGNGAATSSSPAAAPRPPPFTTYKFRSEDSESEPDDGRGGGCSVNGNNGNGNGNDSNDALQRRVSDFVFFSPCSADAVARWAPLDFESDECGLRDRGIPGERYPSDHASVLAVLRLKKKEKREKVKGEEEARK